MGRIRVLDPQVVNQIAAGEVVERPASVVKELVENALDAGARRVRVAVEDGGMRSITVTDDGCGMTPDDAEASVLRHATSKITRLEDLLSTDTLGFRGEALAAIAAVSRLEIVTRPADAEEGYRVVVEGGARRATGVCASPPGTRVTVRDLFYNTPARRKHLRAASTEFARIADVVTAHALARPEVRFELAHNGRTVLRTSGSGDLAVVALECFGPDIAAALLPVRAEEGGRAVYGYVGAPSAARASRSHQFFTVNRRPVYNGILRYSVETAYRNLLPARRYPVAFLQLLVPRAEADVNVHPAKLEVRFVHERAVGALIHRAVREALAARDQAVPGLGGVPATGRRPPEGTPLGWAGAAVTPTAAGAGAAGVVHDASVADDASGEAEPRESQGGATAAGARTEEDAGTAFPGRAWTRRRIFRPGTPRHVRGASWPDSGAGTAGATAARETAGSYDTDRWLEVFAPGDPASGAAGGGPERPPGTDDDNAPGDNVLARLRPLGQVAGTYLACSGPDGLYVVDQHAAHERIYFERFLRAGQGQEVPGQVLAVPVSVDLAPGEHALLMEHRERIEALGFRIEPFGATSVLVRAVPAPLADRPTAELLADLLSRLLSEAVTGAGEPLDTDRAARILAACKAAIKARERLHPEEMTRLLQDLAACRHPYACPHGRPTVVRLGEAELARLFGRTGGLAGRGAD
ncbi:MAG TPA: DNA mismatch repair endonuclease MutL [Thermaerobacter sp.]